MSLRNPVTLFMMAAVAANEHTDPHSQVTLHTVGFGQPAEIEPGAPLASIGGSSRHLLQAKEILETINPVSSEIVQETFELANGTQWRVFADPANRCVGGQGEKLVSPSYTFPSDINTVANCSWGGNFSSVPVELTVLHLPDGKHNLVKPTYGGVVNASTQCVSAGVIGADGQYVESEAPTTVYKQSFSTEVCDLSELHSFSAGAGAGAGAVGLLALLASACYFVSSRCCRNDDRADAQRMQRNADVEAFEMAVPPNPSGDQRNLVTT